MSVTVVLPGVLREYAEGADEVRVDVATDATVADVLAALERGHPLLGRRLRDETGALRRYVNVFVDGDEVRTREGVATAVKDGAVVHVLPSVAGG